MHHRGGSALRDLKVSVPETVYEVIVVVNVIQASRKLKVSRDAEAHSQMRLVALFCHKASVEMRASPLP
eukprot:6076255-Amphidinium_carterae.2